MHVYAAASTYEPCNGALVSAGFENALVSFLGSGYRGRTDPGPEIVGIWIASRYGTTSGPGTLGEARKAMKAYAVTWATEDQLGPLRDTDYPNQLISFSFDPQRHYRSRVGYEPRILLDSGAFSAWSHGAVIDLDEYIAWAKTFEGMRYRPISLDVIPGKQGGGPPGKRERERAMRESLLNGDHMRAKGLHPIEVYHQYEPKAFLEQLIERRQPGEVLGISPRNDISTKGRMVFLDKVFAYFKERYGGETFPPCHGFGISPTSPLAQRYPWYSIDSSSWIMSRKFGKRVDRKGRRVGRDTRNSNENVSQLYFIKSLKHWKRLEQGMTETWERRGVRFSDDPDKEENDATALPS